MELAACRQVMLLTGGPGTGKTTSLRGVLALFETLGLETALAAPTGRAAKRLGELCGAEGTTIHRLLETQYDPHSGRLVFAHDESDPLKADAVIVDETSMVDITLMHGLLSALRPECRLIRTLHPDNMGAGPASYGMTDTMGRMHSDAQFAGSSSVPAHVDMMGLIGMGNNPMVGATVACAVAVEEALKA